MMRLTKEFAVDVAMFSCMGSPFVKLMSVRTVSVAMRAPHPFYAQAATVSVVQGV